MPVPHDNTVLVHILENNELEILSSAQCRVLVVDDRAGKGFEYELVIDDTPELVGEYIDDDTFNWPTYVVDTDTRAHQDIRTGFSKDYGTMATPPKTQPVKPTNTRNGNVITVGAWSR